jgi:glycine cleavage system H protein
MKEIGELNFPDDVKYARGHEWVRCEGESVRVGISDYAQDRLGHITYVDMPTPGDALDRGAQFGFLESRPKALFELFMPVCGEILAVNSALGKSPELVNIDPYGNGWILEVRLAQSAELDTLMSRDEYREMLKEFA